MTFAIAFRMHYRPQTTEYGTPAEADDSNDSPAPHVQEEAAVASPLEMDKDDGNVINENDHCSDYSLLTSLQRFALYPSSHMDHFCFVPMNRISLAWMVVGILLITIDLLNFLLSPVGGILGALLWVFLLAFAYFLQMMACYDPDTASGATQEGNEEAASQHEKSPPDSAVTEAISSTTVV